MIDCNIKTDKQRAIINILFECADKAEAFGFKVPEMVNVSFALNSTVCAGQAGQKGVHRGVVHDLEIDLHGKCLEAIGVEKFKTTAIHEFCHVLQFVNYPKQKNGHDENFYEFMRLMGIDDPKRCHSYDLNAITGKPKRRQRRWGYTCDCVDKVHEIATVTHNKMQKKGLRYFCKICNTDLEWNGKEIK